MVPEILTVITATSTVVGLISLLAYLFYSYRIREIESSERSIRQAVEGEGLFNSDQILQIIKEFKDDKARLAAIKQFAGVHHKSGERIYSKIKSNIDIAHLKTKDQKALQKRSLVLAWFFIILGLLALVSMLVSSSSSSTPAQPKSPLFHIQGYTRIYDFSDQITDRSQSKTLLLDTISLKRLTPQATYFEIDQDLLSGSSTEPQYTSPTHQILIIRPNEKGSIGERHYRVLFDLSNEPLNEWITVQLNSILLGEFLPFLGENAEYKVIYPTDRFQFVFKSPGHIFTRISRSIAPADRFTTLSISNKDDPSFVISRNGDGEDFTWTIEHPRINYRYSIVWWLDHGPPLPSKSEH